MNETRPPLPTGCVNNPNGSDVYMKDFIRMTLDKSLCHYASLSYDRRRGWEKDKVHFHQSIINLRTANKRMKSHLAK